MAAADGAVHRFRQEIKRRYEHEEFVHDASQEGYGIAVLYLGRRDA